MSLDSEVRPFQPPASALPRTHSAALVWVAAVASTLLVGVLLSWVALLRFGDSHGAAQKLLTTEGSPLVNDPTWIIAGTAASELAVGGVLGASANFRRSRPDATGCAAHPSWAA